MTDAETTASDTSALPSDIRVFVNERGVSVPRGSIALDAVRAHSENEAAEITAGRARLTDSRGLPMLPDVVINGGTIMRVLPVRDRFVDANASSTSDGAE